MPIKDLIKRKEYNHEWYLRKKAGLTTKLKPKMSYEERKKRQSIAGERCRRNRMISRRKRIEEKFGIDCAICGGKYYLSLHRKDGGPHRLWREMTNDEFEEMINSNDYIMICYPCHKHVHWCMKYLMMSWFDITNRNSLIPL